MADTLKRMYFGQPTTSSTTLYTAPTGTGSTAVIRNIHICNTTVTDATISLGINGSSSDSTGVYNVYRLFTIPASGIHVANISIVLNSGDTITGLQGTSQALTMVISGVEY